MGKMTDEARKRITKFVRESKAPRKRNGRSDPSLTLAELVIERYGVSRAFAHKIIADVLNGLA